MADVLQAGENDPLSQADLERIDSGPQGVIGTLPDAEPAIPAALRYPARPPFEAAPSNFASRLDPAATDPIEDRTAEHADPSWLDQHHGQLQWTPFRWDQQRSYTGADPAILRSQIMAKSEGMAHPYWGPFGHPQVWPTTPDGIGFQPGHLADDAGQRDIVFGPNWDDLARIVGQETVDKLRRDSHTLTDEEIDAGPPIFDLPPGGHP